MTVTGFFCDFTVAIPTYNGANRIAEVLERLKWQLGTTHIRWEIIVVDNNSSDQTAAVVRRYQQGWSNLRYAFEPTQGAGFARQRAIRLARSPLVGFLDDDNLPSLTWVNRAVKFAQDYPQAGAFGSRLAGKFETSPPQGFNRLAAFLALTERGDNALLYDPEKNLLPPGAGLVVSRQAWLAATTDGESWGIRVRDRDVAEDLEPVIQIQKAGWEVWYNPGMRLTHKIPRNRLERTYLVSLMRGIGLSRFRTRMLSCARWQRPLMVPVYALNDSRRILRQLLKYGPQIWTEAVPAGEMALYCYSLVSPVFWLCEKVKSFWPHHAAGQGAAQLTIQDLHV